MKNKYNMNTTNEPTYLTNTEMALYQKIIAKYDRHHMTVDQLFTELETEFAINGDDLVLSPKEEESIDTDEDGVWKDTLDNREILIAYFEYAAECAIES